MDIRFDNLRRVLADYGERLVAAYRANMEASGRPASGALADSLHTEVVAEDWVIAVDLSLLEYWKYIEHGTAPHWVPIDALKQWASVKATRMKLRPMRNGRLPSPTQLAYMVRNKIAQEGTQGKDDLTRSLEETWAQFEHAIGDAITADVAADLDYVLHVLTKP